MEYIATFTMMNEDGEQITTTRTIDAADARTAHAIADSMNTNDAQVRVYPSTDTALGLMRGALMIARRTAINAVMRQGTPTQCRIERETAAINARLMNAATPQRVNAVLADYSCDTQDMYSVALNGLMAARHNGADIAEQYHAAYIALNGYLHKQRAATTYELSTEFIMDGGGDLVSINAAISAIIRGGAKWTPTDGGTMSASAAARLGETIAAAMRLVTPTQRRIAELLGRGYSQRYIAAIMERNIETIEKNIAIMRSKIADYIRDNAPDFNDLIHSAETATAAMLKRNADRHKNNVERMREYRKRKTAERQAAKHNG